MKTLLLGFVSVIALFAATESAHAVRRHRVVVANAVAPQAVVVRQRVPVIAPRQRVVVRQQIVTPQPVLFVPQSFGFQTIQAPVFSRVIAPSSHCGF